MDHNLLVFILSVLVFVLGAVFINYTVKREDAKVKKEKAVAKSASSETSRKSA